ncbi:hypothetical protein ACFC05_00630 [Streptomyces hydrogenans]|uniref:hypothetical protein n=1 Tax=Streptomyces hydrogenans TaxID=1873719 RepID=UPI0035DFA4AD
MTTSTTASPHRTQSYLTKCRMDDASALLAGTDLSIARIARSVGYADAFDGRAAP